jgi:hypothetical protein
MTVTVALVAAIAASLGACIGVVIAGIIAAGHEESRCALHQPAPRRARHNEGESGGLNRA